MKPHFKPSCTALAAALQLTMIALIGEAALSPLQLHAAVPLAWEVRPTNPAPAAFDRHHGETIHLTATFNGFGELPFEPGADVRLWYQTNGMGQAWWSAPATVASNVLSATWSPALDPGADRVSLFFGAPSNVYASAVLRLRHSPGFTPSELTLPVQRLDFAAVEIANAPYYTKSETEAKIAELSPPTSLEPATNYTDSATNALGSVLRDTIAEVEAKADKVKTASCAWSAYCEDWHSHSFPLAQVSPTNWLFTSGPRRLGGPSLRLDRVGGLGDDGFWVFSYSAATAIEYIPGTNSAPASAMQLEFEVEAHWSGDVWTNLWTVSRTNEVYISVAYLDDVPTKVSQLENDIPFATPGDVTAATNISKEYTDSAIPPAVSNVVTKSYVEDLGIESGLQEEADPVWSADKSNYATKSDLGTVTNDLADLRTESAIVYRLYSGSNVVCEVTNYNSQVHAPTMRLMQLNESNEYFTVWAETNGLTRTLNSAAAYTDSATNSALKSCAHTYAPRAWSRTTSGLGADAPSNTTWISTPRTVIAGGLEYAKIVDTYGEVWVLTSNGMAADFNPDTNAYFRITADDGTPVFSIEKYDAQVVGADAEGITVSANSVVMSVPVVSNEAPTMYWRQSLDSGDWAAQSSPPTGATVTWSGTAGTWVCSVTFTGTRPASMFFRFSFIQEGGVKIRNNAVLDATSGILCTDGIHKVWPVYNNGTITWEVVP